jgi:glycosyltransferase involved in cell wall biosynthesis
LAFLSRLRRAGLRHGHAFYRRYLRRWPAGRFLARQLLRRGLVQTEELQSSGRAEDRPVPRDARVESDYVVPGFHFSAPLNFEIADPLRIKPRINVLLPSLRLEHMSGGPNTALLLAALLAESGESLRLICSDAPAEGEEAALFAHMEKLLGRPLARERIELVDGFDRSVSVMIGVNDLFLATAWWTAQIARYAMRHTVCKTFLYLIQDFEPILHEGSTFQARALETYGLPHIPIINTRLLRDHLAAERAGLYADETFASAALFFEPAIDRDFYTPEPAASGAKKTLLFYARPTVARRNLFEIGVVALRQAVASGVITAQAWDVWAMGENIAPVALGNGVFLNPLPWMSFADYAKRMRTADLLLSLMLSPHPSYPPLEMAACGRMVVTNSFSVKTAAALRAISPNIIAAAPAAEAIAAALEITAGRINAGLGSYDPAGLVDFPASWDASLRDVLPGLMQRIAGLRAAPAPAGAAPVRGLPAVPQTEYEGYRRERLEIRRRDGRYRQIPGLLSFITTAYDTDPIFLEELAASLFAQDGGMEFEWLILDNGSANAATREALRVIGTHPAVRLERVEENLGIVGGMRFCLERATGRYILPLDSDDLIEPDCVHVLTRFLTSQNYPALLFTDEDKLDDGRFNGPYFKPGWDPVLFLHSCYIAHLCAIDRETALQLGLYTAKTAEGCHDWDSFIRFMNAGHAPVHVPEVLYSWRMHRGSTAGNIASKNFITNSHRATLQAALDHRNLPQLELASSPLFGHDVDWWFRRRRDAPVSYLSVVIANANHPLSQLAATLRASDATLVHIIRDGVTPDDDEWRWDAAGLLEMFGDAAMVGGTLHDGEKVLAGPGVFGFGNGFGCPDRGRPLTDPGYSAIMWKPRSVSCVPAAHCVVRRAFLLAALPALQAGNVSVDMLGPWLGALAQQAGRRVLFSPFMRARAAGASDGSGSEQQRAHFLSRFWPQLPDTRFYSPHLGLTQATAYAPVSQPARTAHLKTLQAQTMPYADWLQIENGIRGQKYQPRRLTGLSMLTTIYEKTSALYLDALAESITGQSLAPAQWVIVAHGPIPEPVLLHIRARAETLWRATLVVVGEPLGIMGAMRMALEHADQNYIVPVDADDLLTADAVQILTSEIARLEQPDMVYSDEDLLVKGSPASPYLRAGFDKVLNLDSSYIWHLCAIKRQTALQCGLYTDPGATWCHDWDSVTRISNAQGRIEHIPQVLYHWRQHAGSTTNQAEGDPRSLQSVRHVLQRQITYLAYPERFAVETWPENRGARELYIARRNQDLPAVVWIGDLAAAGTPDDDAVLLITTNDVVLDAPGSYIEAARLLDLHPHLGAVGGLVTGADGRVVDACAAINANGVLESLWLGQAQNYGGLYALAAKPQTVSTTGAALAFFRIAALQDCGAWPLNEETPAEQLAIQLCARLWQKSWGVAFSPLVRGRSGRPPSPPAAPPPGLATGGNALVRYGATRNYRL